MSRATSSTRSVMMTRSLCPRRSWACCASCTLMDPSFPTLNLCGNEHSNCTPWAQRIVEPNLGLPAIQLLDFLYGEWGGHSVGQNQKGETRTSPSALQRRRQEALERYLAGDPIEVICREMGCAKS